MKHELLLSFIGGCHDAVKFSHYLDDLQVGISSLLLKKLRVWCFVLGIRRNGNSINMFCLCYQPKEDIF